MIKRSNVEMECPSVTSISTLREIKPLRELNHENIVQLTDVVIDHNERDAALVMDFTACTLDNVLGKHRNGKENISDYMCKARMCQMLKGLEYMHRNWVLHRDFKPHNILVIDDGKKRRTLQLADMGLARVFRSPTAALGTVDKTVVTLWYRAPELSLGAKHYTTAVDVWSFGYIFAELLFAHDYRAPSALFDGRQNEGKSTHFEADQCKQVFTVLGISTNENWPNVESLPHYKSLLKYKPSPHNWPSTEQSETIVTRHAESSPNPGLQNLLEQILKLNSKDRISASEALSHPCFTDFFENYSEKTLRNALDDPNMTMQFQYQTDYPRKTPKPLPENIAEAQNKVR